MSTDFPCPSSTADPDHGVGIVVDNDCDVLVSFLVAGFIDVDVHEPVKTSGSFRFKVIKGSGDTLSDRFPVNAHVVGESTSGKIFSQPCNGHIELLGEEAVRVSLRNGSGYCAMFRAVNSLRLGFNFHKDPSEIQSPPSVSTLERLARTPDISFHRRDRSFNATCLVGPGYARALHHECR